MDNIKVKVENLSKIFGPNPETIIEKVKSGISKEKILEETGYTVGVADVSFEVKEREIFVIMGLSGSGKSTLIRCLNLLNLPTDGKIYVDNEDIAKFNKEKLRQYRQNKAAMVFQHFGLMTHKSVIGNVVFGLEVKGVSQEQSYNKAKKILSSVGLEGWENKMPGELSGGMQQRVGLARALANDPDILLMDEPFSALDPLIRREMQSELIEIESKLKKTIIFITHDINEAFQLGDRVAVMKDGKIVQVGTPEEIISSPANEYIENFVKDMDRSKVMQAGSIMFEPKALITIDQGLKEAVDVMKENGISSVFVVDNKQMLQGIVTIDDTIRALKENKSVEDILRHDYHATPPDTYVDDLIPKAIENKFPIAVISENNKLLGLIVRVSVLAGLV
ncbi:MAG: glycine betaine/L-proline ABC transporter ATP-binding protein [Clostridiales bacterium]|nr:glycine betaine/L-proline ABC transporter ATP-binding protein [Clostridiales bacterium]MCF8021321.1 glycine betaine/L-proline ABC transporter ATP-binding protein [Clostridiales bacterium]